MTIELVLNGRRTRLEAEPLARLLDVLRDAGLGGVKEGCGEGECGACAVLVDGEVVNSCIYPAAVVAGRSVTTIEGYRDSARYRAIEAAFTEAGGVQCGFCTPGIVLATDAILRANAAPTDDEIRHGLSGNLCRCTGYATIIEAVRLAGARIRDAR